MSDDPQQAELSALRARVAALEAGPRRQRHRLRSFAAVALILVAAVLTPLSMVAVWASQEIGDTDRYVATVAPLASDPAVQDAVANRVTTALVQQIPVDALLSGLPTSSLPRVGSALDTSLTSALTSLIRSLADKAVRSSAFATVWTEANRRIHSSLDKALTGAGGGAVQLTGNAVTIDLAPVVDQVKQLLVDQGVTAAGRIPEVHTQFTVATDDRIGKLKTGFRLLQLAGVWLPVIVLLIAAAGVLLAVRRRRALVTAALAVAAGAVVLGVALVAARAVYLDSLPTGVSADAAAAVFDALVHFIRVSVRTVAVLGVAVALGSWLSGPGGSAQRVRSVWSSGLGAAHHAAARTGMRFGPVAPWLRRHRLWVNWALLAAAALILAFWSHATAGVIVALVLGLLLALALVEFLAEPVEPVEPAEPVEPTARTEPGPDGSAPVPAP